MYNIQHSKNLIKEEESWVTREPVLNIYLRYLPHLQLQGCLEHSMLLMAGRSGYLIPGGARFCPPIQTEPWVKWVQVSSRGVKRPDLGWRLPSTSSSTEAKKRVELKLFSPSEPSWPVLELYLPLSCTHIYIYLFIYLFIYIWSTYSWCF